MHHSSQPQSNLPLVIVAARVPLGVIEFQGACSATAADAADLSVCSRRSSVQCFFDSVEVAELSPPDLWLQGSSCSHGSCAESESTGEFVVPVSVSRKRGGVNSGSGQDDDRAFRKILQHKSRVPKRMQNCPTVQNSSILNPSCVVHPRLHLPRLFRSSDTQKYHKLQPAVLFSCLSVALHFDKRHYLAEEVFSRSFSS